MSNAWLVAAGIFLTGCAHTWNPMDYGVQPNGQASVLRDIRELPDSEIEKICGPAHLGCFEDGVVYYRTGDECALRHELFHVMHGLQHTVEYHQHLMQGTGRICPI